MNYDVVIVASGKGQRAKLGYNKAFYKMKDGKSVLEHSAHLFIEDTDCKKIIIVTNEEYFSEVFENEKVIKTVGGKERKDSVYNGLAEVKSEYVLIHDAARPFLHKNALEEIKVKVSETGAAVLGRMAVDTIKIVDGDKVVKTIDRNTVFMAETPQAFKTSIIKDCYARCEDVNFTDDTSLVESLGYEVSIVIDEYDNHKLTAQEDFKDL
ncbi:MAG: 2-C-methyl-D-erythritol 4-phosphate cytidylyltransferase [Erysipelotrichaceae bacterium]|nr:2-C-methyl-D-erythritol 4-phosphate cytidylyltransferase [Erysipelotrichaceae bacterium]